MNTTTLFNQNNSSSEFQPSRKLSDIEVEGQVETENDLNLTHLPRKTSFPKGNSARNRLEDLKEQRLIEQLGDI